MKRSLILIMAALSIPAVWAQNISKNEAKALQSFLSQPAPDGRTNAQVLGAGGNVAATPGVKVENGHITEIDWKGKNLGGSLTLTGFSGLQRLEVGSNSLQALNVSDAPVLYEINAGRNLISEVTIAGCGQLQTLRLNRNRLA